MLMDISRTVAKRGTCLRAQVGAVMAIEGRIISYGYNGSPPGEPHCTEVGCLIRDGHCIRTIHAEANAICWAARKGIALEGATLYVTGWRSGVCHRCQKLVQAAGIVEIVTENEHGNRIRSGFGTRNILPQE